MQRTLFVTNFLIKLILYRAISENLYNESLMHIPYNNNINGINGNCEFCGILFLKIKLFQMTERKKTLPVPNKEGFVSNRETKIVY